MAKANKIVNPLFLLLLEVIGLIFATGKRVVLPNKSRKGNLLFSLFILFIGIIDILDCFEIGLFQMAKVFRQKHVKRALLIASAFLFLLTTFEWVPGKESGMSAQCPKTEVTAAAIANGASVDLAAPVTTPFLCPASDSSCQTSYSHYHTPTGIQPVKTYLLNCTLLV